jgi:hypothetical protein
MEHLMATPRSMIVDEAVTPWYHCTSRCVRRAFLCGEGHGHRKDWIQARLRELVGIFAIDCGGFAVMDNHLHLLLRLDSPRAEAWSPEEVARRWATLFPLRDLGGTPLPVSEAHVRDLAADPVWVARMRGRLANLGWFMKCLKEPLARLANKEDGCTGAFWEGRYKSVAVLDEASLLATAAYIDLNPLAAGYATTPEASEHTSLRARIDHARADGTLEAVGDDASTQAQAAGQEAGLWLLPTEDRSDRGEGRPGLVAGCTLSCYLRLVDCASRLAREGKAHLDAETVSIFERLRIDAPAWQETVTRLFHATRRTGSHLGSTDRLGEAARRHGRRWHRNLFRRIPLSANSAA